MIRQSKLQELVRKYLDGSISAEERDLLNSWYRDLTSKKLPWYADSHEEAELIKAEMLFQILNETGISKRYRLRKLWRGMAAAAAVLMVCSFSYLLFRQRPANRQNLTKNYNKPDLLPGRNRAILILSNGQQVNLSSVPSGTIARQANANIQKNTNGNIQYKQLQPAVDDGKLIYNTIKTQNGEQWPALQLPDGTIAYLDACSSITFPVSFSGNERRVMITGQVYFEVVHNAAQPFRVEVKGQTIEDKGTHFNVNAYDDEPSIKTTLIEGALSVTKAGKEIWLKPDQQAITTTLNNAITVNNADVDEVIAWRNGLFEFNKTPMPVVMRQISRWYNVTVEYPNGIPATLFTGEMHRNVNASQLLDVLSFFKVHFRIEDGRSGKKIIVLP